MAVNVLSVDCMQQLLTCSWPRVAKRLQGFGNVGAWAAEMLHVRGGRVLCVSDRDGAIHNEQGLDIRALRRHLAAAPPFGGSLLSFPGGLSVPLSFPCISYTLAATYPCLYPWLFLAYHALGGFLTVVVVVLGESPAFSLHYIQFWNRWSEWTMGDGATKR